VAYQLKLIGDFAEMERYLEQLRQVPDSMRTITANLAEETIELIREGFETATNPYGRRWDGLKVRNGQPLRDTGGLQASWHRSHLASDRFTVASSKNYAVYHQRGTGIHGPRRRRIKPVTARALRFPGPNGPIFAASVAGVPKRKMVPDGAKLPARWRERYERLSHEVLTELFK
jgi:phage gpG-like protein